MGNPVFVTRPMMPPIEEFMPYVQSIWDNQVLTNNGPFHAQLEEKLCHYLGVNEVVLFNNGINALICALKALDLTGEVITTPYSFVATAHALLWNNLTPVFVDISEDSFNLNPAKIEAAITEKTTAILPVHCYGHSCDVEAIQAIADQYGLKVIYDAAHAFGVENEHGSILNHGDLSILSFHATKVFNTFEGGAIVCADQAMKQKINILKNFGIVNETQILDLGMNGKLNEMSAAFGLLQLKYMEQAFDSRQQIDSYYRQHLTDIPGIKLLEYDKKAKNNYAYFPILVGSGFPISRDRLYECFKEENIYTRRYFYPLISDFPMYNSLASAKKDNLVVASQLAEQVLCLPIYPDLQRSEQDKVIQMIRGLFAWHG